MRSYIAAAAFAGLAAAVPQVTQNLAPSAPAPAGCSMSAPNAFQITVVNVTSSASKRSVAKRDTLQLKLSNGVLKDQEGRTGYIAANYQFQFDSPPQTGSIYTAGFSLCGNGSLALGGSTIFYQCLSGDFYNLYDRNWAPQCSPIYIQSLAGTTGGISPGSDGQVHGGYTTSVSQRTDGQPIATTGVVSQIGDGQPQAPTGAPVTQIGDGQPQAPTGKPVTQIGDGQPQAPKMTGTPISQIGDGQIQAPTGAAVSQIGDGQVQVGNKTTAAVAQFTGGASVFAAPVAAVAGLVAAVAML